MEKFHQLVSRVKVLGNSLVPYNYPQNDPAIEDDLNALKVSRAVVDGYDVVIYYSKADHNAFFLETVQIYSEHTPFLPFSLVIKVARRFLGSDKLALIEFMRADKRVYCWTIYKDREDNPIDPPHEDLQHLRYEGFEYTYISPASVSFY